MKFCCVFGQASNGKTETGKYIVQRMNEIRKNNEWSMKSFAAPVKQIFMDTFGVDMEFINKWKRVNECPPGFDLPVRQSLQNIGDGFRKIYHNVWVDKALKSIGHHVIDDGRYFSESKSCKEKKGYNILIWRPGYENDDENMSEKELVPMLTYCKHYNLHDRPIVKCEGMFGSTLPVENFDFFLVNDGDLDHLYAKIDSLILPIIYNAV